MFVVMKHYQARIFWKHFNQKQIPKIRYSKKKQIIQTDLRVFFRFLLSCHLITTKIVEMWNSSLKLFESYPFGNSKHSIIWYREMKTQEVGLVVTERRKRLMSMLISKVGFEHSITHLIWNDEQNSVLFFLIFTNCYRYSSRSYC